VEGQASEQGALGIAKMQVVYLQNAGSSGVGMVDGGLLLLGYLAVIVKKASQVTCMGMHTTRQNALTPWHLIALLYVAGLLAALQYAKIPYMLPGLIGQNAISPVQQALVLSVIGIVGAVAGTFAGAVCLAVGLRRTLLFGLAVGMAGALLPLLASHYAMLLVARVVESVAHMAMVVSVPTLMLSLCALKDRPKVMALWSCYFTVTFILAALTVPMLLESTGWHGVATMHAALMLVVGLLCFRVPQESTQHPSVLSAHSLLQAQWRLLRQGKLLVIPATFFGYTMLFVALVSVLPRLLSDTAQASTTLALALPLASLVGTLLALGGLGHGVSGHRLVRVSAVALVLVGLGLMCAPARGLLTQSLILLCFVLLGTLPAGIISSIPAVFNAGDPDITLVNGGLVQFGNLGNFVGSPILAAMLLQFGWVSIGTYVLAGGFIVSVCLLFLRNNAAPAHSE
jgi:MFS transporter, DHA1 family, inner membrane transport protein